MKLKGKFDNVTFLYEDPEFRSDRKNNDGYRGIS